MKKKKLLSLLLATSMVVTGSVGTYMGQVIYKTTAKADDEIGRTGEEYKPCVIDYGNMKFECYFYHSYEQHITQRYQPAVATVTYQPTLYNWSGHYYKTSDTGEKKYTGETTSLLGAADNGSRKPVGAENYSNCDWDRGAIAAAEVPYVQGHDEVPEQSYWRHVVSLKKVTFIGVTGDTVQCSDGVLNAIKDDFANKARQEVMLDPNECNNSFRTDDCNDITCNYNGEIQNAQIWNITSGNSFVNEIAKKTKNVCIMDDVTLGGVGFGADTITFDGDLKVTNDNIFNNFNGITIKGSFEGNGKSLCSNPNNKLYVCLKAGKSVTGLKGTFGDVELWEEGKTYKDGAFDGVTCNSFAIKSKNTKFNNAGIKNSNIKNLTVEKDTSAEFANAGIEGTKITGDFNVQGDTTFAGGAIQDCDINAINLDAKTELQADAIKTTASGKTNIKTLSVNNAAVNWQDGVLAGGTIEKLCFNVNPSYKGTANKGIGAGGTVKEIYFNYTDVNKKVINVDNINLPLGTDAKTSLKCEKIYFFNPAVKLGKATTYKNVGGAKNTEIYYFGGQNGKDTNDANKLKSLDTIVHNMTGNDEKCTYKCVDGTIKTDIKLTKKADSKDVVYTVPGGSELDYATAVTVTRKIDAATLKEQQYYVANSAKWNSNDVTLKLTTKATDNTGVEFYRILKEDSKVKDYSATQYNVKYKDKWYTAVTAAKETLNDEGTVNYIVEAAGSITPFAVEVLSSKVKSIKAEVVAGADKVAIGSGVSSEILKVTATYGNGKTAELGAADYEIEAVKVKEGTNKVKITLKSDNTISDTVTVTGVTCEMESFTGTTEKKEMYVNSTLNLSDVKLNVKFSNIDKASVVEDGFKFVVNKEEVDQVTIKEGENKIAISYKGKTVEDALVITGIKPNLSKVTVEYKGGPVFEMQKVDPSCVIVTYVDADEPDVVKIETSGVGVDFGEYSIEAGKENEITVFYCGVQAENTIKVEGLEDEIRAITSVKYDGTPVNGDTIDTSKFVLVFETMMHNVVSSKDIKGVQSKIGVDKTKFVIGENKIHVTYEDRLSYDFITYVADDTAAEPTIPNGSVFTFDGVKYKTISQENHTAAIVGYDKTASKIKISSTITWKKVKFNVIKIEKNAFKNCKKIKGTVTIDGLIQTIGNCAFMGCKNIKKVVFGKNVKTIGKKCFYGCKSLYYIDLRDATTLAKKGKVGAAAFMKISKDFEFKSENKHRSKFRKLFKGKY